MIHKEHRFERSNREKEQSQSKTALSSGRGKEKEMRDVKVWFGSLWLMLFKWQGAGRSHLHSKQ
jgi:hypothetical protein